MVSRLVGLQEGRLALQRRLESDAGPIKDLRPETGTELSKNGPNCGSWAKTAGVCRELLAVEPALWTFARGEGVEPTNNAAERALRHALLWRKTSHGTDSQAGSRFVENILSIVATCRQQGRNVLDYLTGCCRAVLEGTPPTSLLPAVAGAPAL